jgi:hypothetical protein
MKKLLSKVSRLAICLVFAAGCYYDKEETLYGASIDCSTTSFTYSKDVAPLITAYCATSGCHDASNAGNVTLTSFSQATEQSARINQRVVVERTMPPAVRLTAGQISVIKCWIANGTPQQ